MENLSLQELPPPGGPDNVYPPPAPQGVPQLPPQMFTTAAQLLDLTDTNLVLQDTIERIFVNDLYADIPRGIFLVRGENVLMLGEIDLDKDDYIPEPFRKASAEEVHSLSVARKAERKKGEKAKEKRLGDLGFEVEHTGEVLY
ncbi:SM-like, degradation of cytoplasmic mRNAs and positively regulates transcription initiation [Xylographa bjoerkii]|nr:SM-like, degradation of cytoplasmic mRNAs and positively regulates transcription initiation [Xylographa bjoerkii]